MSRHRDQLRTLPSVEHVVQRLGPRSPHRNLVTAARRAIAEARAEIEGGAAIDPESVIDRAREVLDLAARSRLQPVVNATGVLIHTNLGRVPLSDRQLDAVTTIASGYSNLEYDLAEGRRGHRYEHASEALTTVTGAEAAVVVNNNAAAVLLSLAALCTGREVIISRGELIEIGGEFRIPDVMATSGARLVEVGTTNRTHLADYERAIGPDTAAILKVHPSNYRVVGFTAEVPARDLARLARGRGVPLIHDLGSGLLSADVEETWLAGEVPVQVALADGADIVTFSGDKLLGGPQAGLIVGRRELVSAIAKHPLMRTLRVDKMTLAAIEATATAYLDGSFRDLPLWRLATTPADELEARAAALVEGLSEVRDRGVKLEALPSDAVVGGGSLPGQKLASWAVSIEAPGVSPDELDSRLRSGSPPVVGRIVDDRMLLDLRAVEPDDDVLIASLLEAALRLD